MMKKIYCIFMGIAMFAVDGFCVTNPQISKLLKEKQQKIQKLEQCAKKVNGFKIAGISTLGLTAVGIGGNIALASKEKKLETQIDSKQSELEKQRVELSKLTSQVSVAQEAKRNEEAAAAARAEEEKLKNCQGNLWDAIVKQCPNGCAAITKAAVCNFDLDIQREGGIIVSSDGTFLRFYGIGVEPSRTSVNIVANGVDANGNLQYNAQVGVSGNRVEFTAKGCDCIKPEKVEPTTPEETPVTPAKPEETPVTPAKPEENENQNLTYDGIVGKECTDATKKILHVTKGTFIKIKRNTRQCLEEATQTVVPCECSATECVDGYEVVGGLCKEKQKAVPESNNPKLGSKCTDGLSSHAVGVWEYKDGSAKKCKSKDGTEDGKSCFCKMTGCESHDYEKIGNECIELVNDEWAYGATKYAAGRIGEECYVDKEYHVIYRWASGKKSMVGNICVGVDFCYCKKTTECNMDGLNMVMYERKYNSSTGVCEDVFIKTNIDFSKVNNNNKSFTMKDPYQTQPQDNTRNVIRVR